MRYLQTRQAHIGLALSSVLGTAFFVACLWICLSTLSTTEPQSLKWYACLIGGSLSGVIILAGIAGIVLQIIGFSKSSGLKS